MKRNARDLIGFTMGATDGEIGKVKDFFFDDITWTVRYLVVDTGGWLSGRKVLIAPEAVRTADWTNKVFPVNLTKDQVKNSPEIDTEKPVSRQQEIKLYSYYPWSSYWVGGVAGLPPVSMYQVLDVVEPEDENTIKDDPHLRSTGKVTGYTISAADGDIGDVADFIIDDSSWKIEYLIVDTGEWLPGKKVLISPSWIREISWEKSRVAVICSIDEIKNSPEYDPDSPVDEKYQMILEEHYRGVGKTRF